MAKLDTALWRDMMDHLRLNHAPICRRWFDQLQPLNLMGGILRINTANGVQCNYLQQRCREQFTEAAQAATGALVTVHFVNEDRRHEMDASTTTAFEGSETEFVDPGFGLTTAADSLQPHHDGPFDPFEQVVISPDHRFESFVTGPGNRLAHAAAVAVANQPGHAYNPLFIHGGVGLGKTHLLQAICQEILDRQPAVKICYLSCDAFVNHFLECVQKGRMNDFRHRYRHVDLLVIDDIHFLANRERTQEEFFHTFNALFQSKRQIVLSSDSPPAEIPQLEERLVSRFQSGMVAVIAKPTYETRVAILKSKAALRGIQMPDDVACYVAAKIDSNARELEGAINTILGHATLGNKAIDLALAQEALGEPALGARHSQVTLQQIIDTVTISYNVKLSDLQSKKRQKSIALPRHVSMYLARKRTRFSLEQIGGYFGGRDHTTVMHAIKVVEERVKQDPGFAYQIEQLDDQILVDRRTESA